MRMPAYSKELSPSIGRRPSLTRLAMVVTPSPRQQTRDSALTQAEAFNDVVTTRLQHENASLLQRAIPFHRKETEFHGAYHGRDAVSEAADARLGADTSRGLQRCCDNKAPT
ncbi:hypothetical protein BCR33DRAFT_716035 [Rhizoclosmatium globosum]|uniref:Uncharacterized protein n=1 Tax=Rhizoclosmatium globosum TaxID=329046 RepID=A0A1Y2CG70_9FUNG|nr:hypothetical protein BCR33DRAFT_716035 [Rhizoclosmatium globosum]|eukprot:ORY46029.1 hypothetical protein BCR33DRAFT_716035 [Rhizoclosmatium globosum]